MTISQLQIGNMRCKEKVFWKDLQPLPDVSYKSLDIFAKIVGDENLTDHYKTIRRNILSHHTSVKIWNRGELQSGKKLLDTLMALYLITLSAGPFCAVSYPEFSALGVLVMTVSLCALAKLASYQYNQKFSRGIRDKIDCLDSIFSPLTTVPQAWKKTGNQQKRTQKIIDDTECVIQKHLPLLKSSLGASKEKISTRIDLEMTFLNKKLEELNSHRSPMSDFKKIGKLLNDQIRDYRAAIVELGKLCQFFSLG